MVEGERWCPHACYGITPQQYKQTNCFVIKNMVSLALEPVLKLALVGQAGLELTESHLPLPPEFWD